MWCSDGLGERVSARLRAESTCDRGARHHATRSFLLAALFIIVFHHRLHAVHGWLQLLRIANAILEHCEHVEVSLMHACEIVVIGGQRWATLLAWRGNDFGELDRIHTAPGENLVWIPQEPNTISRIHQEVRGDYSPMTGVVGCRLLAIPQLCLGNVGRGV